MILKVGLTGGIGSGKSTVAKVFETLGIPVYYADAAARRLMMEDEEVKTKIIAQFGEKSYVKNELNRAFIAAKVFADEKQLALLNAITHPATIRDAANWMSQQTSPYAIKEAALIFESGSDAGLDFIIGVSAPASLRLQRTMKRDGLDEADVADRMRKQMPEEEKMKRCNAVIVNDEKQMIIPQVLALHERLLNR